MTSKPRYARLQVDADAIPDDDKPPQTGHTFNIWYLKWAGGDSGSRHVAPSKFRVNIQKDSGTTRGVDGKSPICLFFARGCCYKGRKCAFLHRLPRHGDVHIPTQDCFGRDKTADYRDDMGGVGSLQRQNTTLYVSGAHMGDHVHEEMHRQFSEFGQIDKIRVLPGKNCAFVSFRLEAEAQFAKEAMDAQSLDGKDILTVKWANDDPNPQAQKSAKRSLEELAMETVHALLNGGGTEGPEGPNKRRNLEGLSSSKGASKEASKVAPKAPKEAPKEPKEAYNDTQTATESSENSGPRGILDASRLSALKKLHNIVPQKKQPSSATTATTNNSVTKTDTEIPVKNGNTFLAGYSSDEEED